MKRILLIVILVIAGFHSRAQSTCENYQLIVTESVNQDTIHFQVVGNIPYFTQFYFDSQPYSCYSGYSFGGASLSTYDLHLAFPSLTCDAVHDALIYVYPSYPDLSKYCVISAKFYLKCPPSTHHGNPHHH